MNLELVVQDNAVILRLPARARDSALQELVMNASSDLMFAVDDSHWEDLTEGHAADVPMPLSSWRHLLNRVQRSHDFWRKPENRKRFRPRDPEDAYTLEPLTFTVAGVVYDDIDKIPGPAEETTLLGLFQLDTPTILATDPCYSKGTWCTTQFEALPGTWRAQLVRRDDGYSGHRNAILTIAHDDVPLESVKLEELEELADSVGVDSGQAGFFEKACYPQNPSEAPGIVAKQPVEVVRIPAGERGENPEQLAVAYAGIPVDSAEEYAIGPTAVDMPDEAEDGGRMLLDIPDDDDDDKSGRSWYEQVCDVTLDDSGVNAGIAPGQFGVVSQTFYGDGGYPCFVKKNDAGQVIAAVLVFDDSTRKDEDD